MDNVKIGSNFHRNVAAQTLSQSLLEDRRHRQLHGYLFSTISNEEMAFDYGKDWETIILMFEKKRETDKSRLLASIIGSIRQT